MPEFAAGEILTATNLSRRGIAKYGRRNTTSSNSASTTAVGVLRLDTISVVSGRSYVINISCHPNSTVTTDNIDITVRGSTAGNATTASPVLTSGEFFINQIGAPVVWRFVYIAGSTATLSILLCVARFTGTGNCNLYADGTRNTELWIEDMGIATDTGVDI